MSLYVLIYDRTKRQLVELREFAEDRRTEADEFRLDAQLRSLREHLDQEIVLFQAASKEALTRSHGSYILSVQELAERAKAAAS